VLVCRYYRSVVCALALAATASLRAQSVPARSSQAAATLHLQAAKVSLLTRAMRTMVSFVPCVDASSMVYSAPCGLRKMAGRCIACSRSMRINVSAAQVEQAPAQVGP
jgi:hypothetical protein